MSGNLAYNPLENLDHHQSVAHKTPQQNSHEAERFSEYHGGGGATSVALNSSRSNNNNNNKPMKAALDGSGSSSRSIYRECLKNHAASVGGNVTDGCGEFMPSGEQGTMEALKCAACNCHRNFHRREIQHSGSGENNNNALVLHHHHHLQLPSHLTSLSLNHHNKSNTPTPPSEGGHHQWANQQPMAAFMGSGSVATDSSSEELNFNAYHSGGGGVAHPPPPYGLSKKRFRTKFTHEQKEKMLEFAEKLGWRIPREDDNEVQRFCAEVGVKRQVFKVWMHNNKTSSSSSSSKKNIDNNNNPQEPLIIMNTSS